MTILQQGDRQAWEAFQRKNPGAGVTYDAFQKLLYMVHTKAIADAEAARMLFVDTLTNNRSMMGMYLNEFAGSMAALLDDSDLRIAPQLTSFLTDEYRKMFTVACQPYTVQEQLTRRYAVDGVTREEYKLLTEHAKVEVQEVIE